MKYKTIFTVVSLTVLIFAMACQAEIETVAGHNGNESATFDFKFKNAPQPSQNDAATKATFTIVDGRRDRNGGNLDKLHDGKVPTEEDQPSENFFFNAQILTAETAEVAEFFDLEFLLGALGVLCG